MAFSGGVKLGDLDDFISPSQECVKPLIQAAEGGGAAKIGRADSALSKVNNLAVEPVIAPPQVQKPNLIKSRKSAKDPKAEIGQVTLSDCLACSGCVTSAETVLLQEQSGAEFLKRAQSSRVTVVSIFSEARASLAQHLDLAPLEAMQRVAAVLSRLGASYVLEGSAAESMALLEGKAEFVRRFREANGAMPLLTSHCPGWTCYAEKIVDPVVMPHLSPLRPPQQVQGRLAKTCLLEAHNRRELHRWWRGQSPLFALEHWRQVPWRAVSEPPQPAQAADLYHVCVQPCFDRKIEASRPHFQIDAGSGVREVDTVLTTTELLDLITGAAGTAIPELPEGSPASEVLAAVSPCGGEVLTDLLLGDLASRPQPFPCPVQGHAGSGGFLEHVFREAARELFQAEVAAPLEFRTCQNEDMREVLLQEPGSQRVLLRFVSAMGFRNIQNVIRRITKRDSDPSKECGHFVEIMACPGGCLNGAGQVPQAKGLARQERLARLEDVLHGDAAVLPPAAHPLVLPLYRYVAARAEAGGASAGPSLSELVGSQPVRSWLAAQWKSLKVDDSGKAVLQSSALKW